MNHEVWKDININNVNSGYRASNFGQIKNSKDQIMSYYVNNSGYYCIKLSMNDIKYNFLVHRLVAQAFIPNPDNKPQVNHKDGNKLNNWVDNLEWVTAEENMKHAALNKLLNCKNGSDNPFAKHNNDQIHYACKLLETGKYTLSEISNITKVKYRTLWGIVNDNKWKEVSSCYNIIKPVSTYAAQWDDNTKNTICKLHHDGYTYKECLEIINEPVTPSNILRANRLFNKIETSTTIPLESQ